MLTFNGDAQGGQPGKLRTAPVYHPGDKSHRVLGSAVLVRLLPLPPLPHFSTLPAGKFRTTHFLCDITKSQTWAESMAILGGWKL